MRDSKAHVPAQGTGDRPTSLYRFYDEAGTLLYVGITHRGPERFHQHEREKTWWTSVHTTRVEHHPNRAAALQAEAAAIRAESPLHNVQHSNRTRHTIINPRVYIPCMESSHLTDGGCCGAPSAVREPFTGGALCTEHARWYAITKPLSASWAKWPPYGWSYDDYDAMYAAAGDQGVPCRTARGDGAQRLTSKDWSGHPIEWAAAAYRGECGWDYPPRATDGTATSGVYIYIHRGSLVGFLITDMAGYQDLPEDTRIVTHAWTAARHRRQGVATTLVEMATHDGHIHGYDGPYTDDGEAFVLSRPTTEVPDWCHSWIECKGRWA